ncbi:MAG TPA: ABC transporter permease [Anaerolineae bacterium]|nr:ABC transporter permease [Anaerolineae bacterium]
MAKLLTVAQQEIVYHFRQWTYVLSLVVMPLLLAALGAIPQIQAMAAEAPLPRVETVFDAASEDLESAVGYVDRAGLIRTHPEANADKFVAFEAENAAANALNRGEIESYYVIAEDYLVSGQVTQYSHEPQLLSITDTAVRRLLAENTLRLLANPQLAARLDQPVVFERAGPPPPALRFLPDDVDLRQLSSAGVVIFVFVYGLNVGGNFLIRALQREVKAKVLEVMIATTTPAQFIGGKLLGLLTVTLLQMGVTLSVAVLVYGRNASDTGPAALPVEGLLLGLPYLILGFVAFCGGTMSLAAIWPNLREGSILNAVLRALGLLPLVGGLFILPNADGAVAIGLTLLPVTSHLLMPLRLLLTEVPVGQWGLGLIFAALWTWFWLWLSIRLFRLNGLLTGQSLSPRQVWQALRQ